MPKVKHRQWVLTLHNSRWVRHKQSVNPSLLSSGWLPDGEENVSERGHEREAEKTSTGSEVERSGIYFYTVSHLKIVLINRPLRFFLLVYYSVIEIHRSRYFGSLDEIVVWFGAPSSRWHHGWPPLWLMPTFCPSVSTFDHCHFLTNSHLFILSSKLFLKKKASISPEVVLLVWIPVCTHGSLEVFYFRVLCSRSSSMFMSKQKTVSHTYTNSYSMTVLLASANKGYIFIYASGEGRLWRRRWVTQNYQTTATQQTCH